MFPSGVAGAALFLLRLVCALPLVWVSGFDEALTVPSPFRLVKLSLTVFVLCGAFTPIACSVIVLLGLLSLRTLNEAAAFPAVLHVMTTAALMMLGPGAYSLDAKLFGRRLILPPE